MKAAIISAVYLPVLLSTVFLLNEGANVKKHRFSEWKALETATNGNNKFSFSLYKTLASSNVGENFVTSPLSLHIGLTLMYLGAEGNTAQQMATGLHIPQEHSIVKIGFRQLQNSLKSSQAVNLQVANRLFLQSSYNILKQFRRTARKVFGADVREVNFEKNPEKATKIINTWVEKRTNNKISQIIGQGVLTPSTKMVLVNAVYLKAEWLNQFNTDDTKMQTFHISATENIDIPMMRMKTYFGFKHSEELGAKILELPYKGETASMFVLLPDKMDDLEELETKMQEFNLPQLFKDIESQEVNVTLPKFKAESSVMLKENLKELGFKDMFNMQAADFSGITGSPNLVITQVLQKAFVEVTELGTEAGASTAIVLEPRMWKPAPPDFVADHPFIFIIWEKTLNTALFMGRFTKPQ